MSDPHKFLERVAICLVEPLQPGNIGSVARAMKNMGLSSLRLVNPPDLNDLDCRKMAVGAWDLVENARVFTSLREAIEPFHVRVSTTRRLGARRTMDFTPRTFGEHLARNLGEDQSAVVVFGREDKGLNTDELELAPMIVTIPSDSEYESLNVAQAVMVVAYELRIAQAGDAKPESRESADSGQIEGFFDQFLPLMTECGFLAKKDPQHVVIAIRKMLHKADPDHREIKILRGMCADMEWYLNHVAKVGKRDGQRTLDGRGGA